MNLATLEMIRDELAVALTGRRFGKVFPLSRNDLAVDLRLTDSSYLFISVDPSDPRIYLIRRRIRELEKASGNPSPFVLLLKKYLSGAEVEHLEMMDGERVLLIFLSGESETGDTTNYQLIVQLTGRSANLFLADHRGFVVDSLRQTEGEGQEPGTRYSPPSRPEGTVPPKGRVIAGDGHASLSDALDEANLRRIAEEEFNAAANSVRARIKQEIAKRERLLKRLESDLAEHGDADRWKKYGDLLLANISNAKREGGRIFVVDYFDETQPTIEIETDENDSLTGAAEKFFRQYTKARNAGEEIEKRRDAIDIELERLREENDEIEEAVAAHDLDRIREFGGRKQKQQKEKPKGKESPVSSVARIFMSSDGYEILVGKRAKDNDLLTFRIAKSLDTWMHAADYPGSHVVIRNPNRKEIPQRTLFEAAQLAAFYSQGKSQPKAAVHYTQKKFVNKPKGAAAGLVSLASFKTLLVEPGVPDSVSSQQ